MSISQKLAGLAILLKFDNWPVLLLARIFDRRTGLVVYRKASLEVLVDHRGGDENGTRTCLASDMYSRHLRRIPKNGPERVLDLGANGGGFPLLLRLEGRELDRVVSVEMNPPTYLRLLVNLSANLGHCATGINAAVGAMPPGSEIMLQPCRGSTSLSAYDNRTDSSLPHVVVRTTTLEELYGQYFQGETIDICKIDIEGAEYETIQSSPDAILQKIRTIIIEFHDPPRTPACVQRLLRLGFVETTGEEDPKTGDASEVRVFSRPLASP